MTMVKFDAGEVEVDAAIIGKGLHVVPSIVQELIRSGRITSRHERGEGADVGRSRLTFFYGNRRFHIIVSDTGEILQRAVVDFGEHPLPRTLRGPGR
jgi:hypothetical protein